MPTELPGFYWDEAKNRYFPISSRPRQSTVSDACQKPANSKVESRLRCLSWNRNETIRTTNNYIQRLRASQQVMFISSALPSSHYIYQRHSLFALCINFADALSTNANSGHHTSLLRSYRIFLQTEIIFNGHHVVYNTSWRDLAFHRGQSRMGV